MKCTHGCSHYHPDRPKDHGRCDVHGWAWEILDIDNYCHDFDGQPYKERRPKPKKIKQPQGAWQTGLDVFQGFPYCCQSFLDNKFNHVQIGNDEDGEGPIIAFNCDYSPYPYSKITTLECRGEGCPHCKLVQINEYNKHIGGTR